MQNNLIAPFALHPNIKCHLLRIGSEKTSVILIDNFLADISVIQEHARKAQFQQEKNTYYPGVRAMLKDSYVDFILTHLSSIITKTYRLEPVKAIAADNCYFSLVNQPPINLTKHQCIPHFDALNKRQFAIMHYINLGEFGGTGFYRHVPTGFENIDKDNLTKYCITREEHELKYGLPYQAYINGSTEEFTLLGKITYKQNRLVIYPGTLLHSGLIKPSDLSKNSETGRLTANIFAEFK
ncbi:DUF6445 family protein [Catenovulum adriaticum]|uniref:DUF6445 family protein n=1 Tax=Catenovulum adriaticum TaxID=2984846 RepID=A0ABY7AV30_9ALTE|nr:DUF6445 family protein [Catenovulum sp. TS8]WAJ72481.1 DUF6445 family protein [Catenovulum sp. TS8]